MENFTNADSLLELRAQLDGLEETTVDPIEKSLIGALKRIYFKQHLESSKHATETWKNFIGKNTQVDAKKQLLINRC